MFIQFIKGRTEKPEEVMACLDRWHTDVEPGAIGYLGTTYGMTDAGEMVAVVRFADAEKARQNSDRPEQGAWWATMEPLFDGPVEFADYDGAMTVMDGGSDDAGFVQVMRGHTGDPERARRMMDEMDSRMRGMRADVIGMTVGMADDGTFTQTVAFTSESEARANEQQEMPEDMREAFEGGLIVIDEYLDLHHPRFLTHA